MASIVRGMDVALQSMDTQRISSVMDKFEQQFEDRVEVVPVGAVGPAGVGIVVESSTSCGQSLSIFLRHGCRVLLLHRVVCCAHQEGCEISLVLLVVESCGGHDFGRSC